MHKTVQTMGGPVFVAGRSKECVDPDCSHSGARYYASGVLKISLPHSTYGLDVLAYIGWQHDKEHRQFVEIQRGLNGRGILINERTVGKLYRQFLALLGGASAQTLRVLETTAHEHGGLIWAIDALQPEGHGTLLYVLYEVLSGTPVAAIQSDHPPADELDAWLTPYSALPYQALATLSDGEEALVATLKKSWPNTPHQRCQEHVLGNIAEPVLQHDTELRKRLRDDLGGLPAVPEQGAGSTAPAPDQPPTASMDVAEWGPGPACGGASGDEAGLAPVPGSAVSQALAPGGPVSHGQPEAAPLFLPIQRDAELMQVEVQIRMAIRDAVNRASRKPFYWGGLVGYRQLEAITQALHTTPCAQAETAYLHQLTSQVDRALERNRVLAQDVAAAHVQLQRIADCLRYPPRLAAERDQPRFPATSQQVRDDMERLLKEFKPDVKRQPAQATLSHAWQRVWATCGPDLLHCYDIPGLPQDNLQLEAFFGQLRRAQRRISGRKSTAELRDFGQYRTLFTADNEAELLQQIRQVSLEDYEIHRRRLQEAEAPRKLLYRLHRDPLKTMQTLVNQHTARRTELASNLAANPP